MQKTGLLDFKTDITGGDGRCYWWLDPKWDSLASQRGYHCPRDSVGPRCKNWTKVLNILLGHCMLT